MKMKKYLFSTDGHFASDPSLTPFDHAIYDLAVAQLQ